MLLYQTHLFILFICPIYQIQHFVQNNKKKRFAWYLTDNFLLYILDQHFFASIAKLFSTHIKEYIWDQNPKLKLRMLEFKSRR